MKGRRLAVLGGVAWVVLSLVLPWLPGVGLPGYLQAFVVGAAVPVLLAPVMMALARWLDRHMQLPGTWCVLLGALLGALPSGVSHLMGMARGTLCMSGPAWAHVALGPMASGAVVGATAWVVTTWVAPGWRAGLLYVGVVAAHLGLTLWGPYNWPQVFALDHYFGHFRGPLYDVGQATFDRPLALRAVSLAYVVLLLTLARLYDRRGREGQALMALAVVLFVVTRMVMDPVVAPGRAAILEALPTTLRTPHAVVHLDGARWPAAERTRLLAEVERHITELGEAVGQKDVPPVEVFLYANAEEKFRLLGASNTLLARPWAREIHVQGGTLPVGALRHELAHVVLGDLGKGPFGVPGMLGGLIPNLLLVEGMATALDEDEGRLPLHTQAAVLKRMGKLPRVRSLARPWGFLLESGARSYTAAGSFLRFVGKKHGGKTLGGIYSTGSLPRVGLDVLAVEGEWHAFLDTVEAPAEGADAQAQRVFRRQSVVEARCVDDTPVLWAGLHQAAGAGAWDDANGKARALLALDPRDDEPLLALLDRQWRAGEFDRAGALEKELGERGLDALALGRVQLMRAEALFRNGELGAAAGDASAAVVQLQGTTEERGARVEAFALGVLAGGGEEGDVCLEAAMAIMRFLAGEGPEKARRRADLLALERAAVTAPTTAETCGEAGPQLRAVLRYLQGRQLAAEDPARADAALSEANELGLPFALLSREAARQRGEAAEHQGNFEIAFMHFATMGTLGTTPGEKAEAQVLQRRARFAKEFAKKQAAPPATPPPPAAPPR